MPACHTAICADFRGPNNTITLGESATNVALAEAANWIREGDADAVLVGGVGDNLQPYSWLHNALEKDLAGGGTDPDRVCRPFDRDRTGGVVAEGAAAFLLEEYEAAVRRGAPIYGEIVAASSSCVVDRHHVAHCGRALANALRTTLHQADCEPAEIGHLHAHGLSSPVLDREESRAIRDVLGGAAARIPVVAAKSHFGNAGAGSSALEFAASLLAMQHGRLFPIRNCVDPDPECPIRPVTTGDVAAGSNFVNLSFSPHGQASCVMVRKAA
jgi:3-oxoacyl-[acyl-carrier-protein] synthase II